MSLRRALCLSQIPLLKVECELIVLTSKLKDSTNAWTFLLQNSPQLSDKMAREGGPNIETQDLIYFEMTILAYLLDTLIAKLKREKAQIQ